MSSWIIYEDNTPYREDYSQQRWMESLVGPNSELNLNFKARRREEWLELLRARKQAQKEKGRRQEFEQKKKSKRTLRKEALSRDIERNLYQNKLLRKKFRKYDWRRRIGDGGRGQGKLNRDCWRRLLSQPQARFIDVTPGDFCSKGSIPVFKFDPGGLLLWRNFFLQS